MTKFDAQSLGPNAANNPETIQLVHDYCFPEIDPKIGGFWVIGPDDSIAYSSISCIDALRIDNLLPPATRVRWEKA